MNCVLRLKYIISLPLLWIGFFAWGQGIPFSALQGNTTTQQTKERDTIEEKKEKPKKKMYNFQYAFRFGTDLNRFFRQATQPGYSGWEVSGDLRISKNNYLAFEYGQESKHTYESTYDFTSRGNYLKLGFDYNLTAHRYHLENSIYVGARYAFANYSQTVHNYTIFNQNTYWKENNVPGNDMLIRESPALRSDWVEIVLGFRGEVFKNVYLGASGRFAFNVTNSANTGFPGQWIPGFVRVVSENRFSASINYSITYRIPIIARYKIIKPKPEDLISVPDE